jgi:predicted DCC family thiol-disulfide oxidoreductase YuxK
MNQITVIFDGQCHFCQQSVTWIARKLTITALPYQTSDLAPFNLTKEQCAKQVYVISQGVTYGGADAIAYLLKQRGNRLLYLSIKAAGPLARIVYKWIATHRNTWPVKAATTLLTFLNRPTR